MIQSNLGAISRAPFTNHLLNRKHQNKKARKVIAVTLMLTSMVDMFSMLVVFLLQTFSSSPEILITKGVVLPDSFTAAIVKEAPVLSVSKDEVFLDQKLVGKLTHIIAKPRILRAKLDKIKSNWGKSHPKLPFPGEINLQADKDVPSTLVSKLMGIVTSVQFQKIQLAVISGGA